MKRLGAKNDGGGKKDKARAADADAEHFAREMRDVVRLKIDPRGRVRARPPITALRSDSGDQIRRTTLSTSAKAGIVPRRAALSGPPEDDGFVAPGIDRRQRRKLKRGEYVPGSRLDLHGKTAVEAVACVKRFIDAARHVHRAVCIVHGRGLHSEGNLSVLKSCVRDCLRRHPAVLAYSDAPRTDGGSGAVYVLLRK